MVFISNTLDISSTSITFPQPIRLFGLPGGVTTALVVANGYMMIGGSTRCCDNVVTPSTSNSLFVAPWWDDLQGFANVDGGTTPNPDAGINERSRVWWRQTGTPGNVETIISWENWSFFPQRTYLGTTINFQVHFRPNGDIEFHYGPSTVGPAPADAFALSQGSSASVWIEAVTAADIFVARNDDAVVPTTRPLVNGLGIRYSALRP